MSDTSPPIPVNTTEILLSLPNPFTPLAFLPPDIAWQVSVAMHWIVGSLAVLVWDIVSNLHNDFVLLTKYRINISMVFYCISRLSCLAYILLLTVLQTAPIGGNCPMFDRIQPLFAVAMPSTCLLFLVRVSALYRNKKFVIAFFVLLWLGVVGACITPTLGTRVTRLGISDYCIGARVEEYVGLAGLLPLIYDTLIFAATSFALLRNSYVEGVQNGFKVLVFGNYLPAFSKAILHDGQIYYLTTIGVNLTTVVMIYSAKVSVAYTNALGVTGIVLTNMMACLVYRKVRFGVFKETASNPTAGRTLATSRRSTMPNFQQQIMVSFTSTTVASDPAQTFSTAQQEEIYEEGKEKIQMDQLGHTRSDAATDLESRDKSRHESEDPIKMV